MKIEVCGPGCARCQLAGKNVREAVKELGMDSEAQVVEIHDIKEISARGVLVTPAVFIVGVKVCQGRIPSAKEVRKWLEEKR
jgi:small redox-active disulfide protein 2